MTPKSKALARVLLQIGLTAPSNRADHRNTWSFILLALRCWLSEFCAIATTTRKTRHMIGQSVNNNLCDSNFREARRNFPHDPTYLHIATDYASFAPLRILQRPRSKRQSRQRDLTEAKMGQTSERLSDDSARSVPAAPATNTIANLFDPKEAAAALTWWRIYGSQVPKASASADGRAKAAFAFAMQQQERMRAALARMQSELYELVQHAVAVHDSLPGTQFESEIGRNVAERDGQLKALNTTMWLCFAFLMYLRKGGGVPVDEEVEVDVWSDV
ncbi:uncharacterized protein J3D65DRAFT_658982 [Phyllosticta citribraziliensis]|uniref:Uncharacterized protein n=1 Tax=Phyllosticta citribraziliensis TaxID=989973 RepID=A0ABR1LKL8_9PEZI